MLPRVWFLGTYNKFFLFNLIYNRELINFKFWIWLSDCHSFLLVDGWDSIGVYLCKIKFLCDVNEFLASVVLLKKCSPVHILLWWGPMKGWTSRLYLFRSHNNNYTKLRQGCLFGCTSYEIRRRKKKIHIMTWQLRGKRDTGFLLKVFATFLSTHKSCDTFFPWGLMRLFEWDHSRDKSYIYWASCLYACEPVKLLLR